VTTLLPEAHEPISKVATQDGKPEEKKKDGKAEVDQ